MYQHTQTLTLIIKLTGPNQIAHKVTTAMVSPGILSLAAKKIAAAAISAPSNYDIKYLGLLEPKAEPFEYSGTATMIGKQGNQQPTTHHHKSRKEVSPIGP